MPWVLCHCRARMDGSAGPRTHSVPAHRHQRQTSATCPGSREHRPGRGSCPEGPNASPLLAQNVGPVPGPWQTTPPNAGATGGPGRSASGQMPTRNHCSNRKSFPSVHGSSGHITGQWQSSPNVNPLKNAETLCCAPATPRGDSAMNSCEAVTACNVGGPGGLMTSDRRRTRPHAT